MDLLVDVLVLIHLFLPFWINAPGKIHRTLNPMNGTEKILRVEGIVSFVLSFGVGLGSTISALVPFNLWNYGRDGPRHCLPGFVYAWVRFVPIVTALCGWSNDVLPLLLGAWGKGKESEIAPLPLLHGAWGRGKGAIREP